MQKLNISKQFWLNKKAWPLILLFLTFLGELPFIIIMDIAKLPRAIYGTSTLRLNLANFFGSNDPFIQIFGWILDFDKIFPWILSIITFLLFKKELKKIQNNDVDKDITKPFSRWVFIFGLIGGGIITWHYLKSGGGHWGNYKDKGLIDAIGYLFTGDNFWGWFGMIFYRLNYLILSPFMFFTIFTTIGACLNINIRLIKKVKNNENLAKHIASFFIISAIPAIGMFVLHDIISWVLNIDFYNPNAGRRRFLLYSMYVFFILSIIIQGYLLKKEKRNLYTEITLIASKIKYLNGQVIRTIGLISMFLIYPSTHFFYNVELKPLNASISAGNNLFIGDNMQEPEERIKSKKAFLNLLDKINYQVYTLEILGKSSILFKNIEQEEVKSLIISSYCLLRIGGETEEIQSLINLHSRGDIKELANKIATRFYENNKSNLKMYYLKDGTNKLNSEALKSLESFYSSYIKIIWKSEVEHNERINEILSNLKSNNLYEQIKFN